MFLLLFYYNHKLILFSLVLLVLFYSLVEIITNKKELANNLDDKLITQITLTLIPQVVVLFKLNNFQQK